MMGRVLFFFFSSFFKHTYVHTHRYTLACIFSHLTYLRSRCSRTRKRISARKYIEKKVMRIEGMKS